MKARSCHSDSDIHTLQYCELFVVVRPEDKAAVSRVLEAEIGSGYISYHALGRGCEGGLAYGEMEPSRRWFSWAASPMIMAFLPKIVFWAVLEKGLVQELVAKVGAAVRQNGGPSLCAGGFAVMADMGAEIPVGFIPERAAIVHDEPATDFSSNKQEVTAL